MVTKSTTKRVWGIRAGKDGDAHDLFLDNNVIALADAELGDLSRLEPTRDTFYAAYRKHHPNETRGGSAGVAGKFFRFAHEVQVGDLVVYPALPDKMVYVGEVTGVYLFKKASDTPHQRSVKWKYLIPKSEFSQSAQFELGAARTMFEFKKHSYELMKRINDSSVSRFSRRTKSTVSK